MIPWSRYRGASRLYAVVLIVLSTLQLAECQPSLPRSFNHPSQTVGRNTKESVYYDPGTWANLPPQLPFADPTGQNDSSPFLNAEIRRICSLTASPYIAAPRDAVLDLQGGLYKLDSPLVINESVVCTGVLRIRGGTLLGGSGLSTLDNNSSFLVTVLHHYSEFGVSLEQIIFASNFTSGGLRVDAATHVHVLDCRFVNFKTIGIWGSNLLGMGHDLTVDTCVLTECTLPFSECGNIATKHATAIVMEFPDSHFRNTIITCASQGIVVKGGANTFHQLHIWPSCNQDATGANLTVAISEESGNNRYSDLYIDNSIFRVKRYIGSTITNSFFNGHSVLELADSIDTGTVNLTDPICEYWRGAMCGMIITNNRFSCSNNRCATIVPTYKTAKASQIYVHTNAFQNTTGSVCSKKTSCSGLKDCETLFGPC